MKVLIAYATTEGQTRKIATTTANQLRELGHEVRLADVALRPGDIHADDFDAVIIAASVHQDRHQDDIEAFVAAARTMLSAKPTMFLSVSLAAAFEESGEKAEHYIARFEEDTGWKASTSLAVAGALQGDEYDYYHQQILEHVVLKHRAVDHPEQEHEFTDWASLASAVESFLKEVSRLDQAGQIRQSKLGRV
jgi:menaquinone-dependent protoporphyrinogen oxidase